MGFANVSTAGFCFTSRPRRASYRKSTVAANEASQKGLRGSSPINLSEKSWDHLLTPSLYGKPDHTEPKSPSKPTSIGKSKLGKAARFASLSIMDKMGVFNVSFNAANTSCDGSVCLDPVPMLLAISFAFGKAEELAEAQGDAKKL